MEALVDADDNYARDYDVASDHGTMEQEEDTPLEPHIAQHAMIDHFPNHDAPVANPGQDYETGDEKDRPIPRNPTRENSIGPTTNASNPIPAPRALSLNSSILSLLSPLFKAAERKRKREDELKEISGKAKIEEESAKRVTTNISAMKEQIRTLTEICEEEKARLEEHEAALGRLQSEKTRQELAAQQEDNFDVGVDELNVGNLRRLLDCIQDRDRSAAETSRAMASGDNGVSSGDGSGGTRV
ncbi:hypothetical protein BU23DRAFT_660859 [Bimuria novae-zelandiae CBS 107.79]|uniref:Uncharacterized protein n=1 Tax=Bimuria novae-zelandiae CBS 107.79 TaxID=1447943 RepID=A0A6A5UQQ1_9PLEO|nr:hypothetical protein BU23DRAFT_660859 [Bimuria novae-zelandiae CBS 107.79]